MKDATCPALYAALEASEKGIPFMPLRGIIGSDLLSHRDEWRTIDNPFGNDDPIVVLPAIKPDVALFHAPLADKFGNVWIGRPRELVTLAHASAKTVVTVEKIIDTNLLDDPSGRRGHCRAYMSMPSRWRRAARGHCRCPTIIWLTSRISPNTRASPQRRRGLRNILAIMSITAAPPEFRDEEFLASIIADLIGDVRHVAVGNASPIPATAALLARARGDGRPYVSLLGSRKHTSSPMAECELFDCAGQGRIDVFFLSGGQIDGEGNINLVSIGEYERPTARFPGSFGSAYLYYVVPKVILFRTEHSRRTLVPKVDFISAPGTSESNVYRTGGPVGLITNRCSFPSTNSAGASGSTVFIRAIRWMK